MDAPVPALTSKAAILLSLVEGPGHGGAVAKRAHDRTAGALALPDGTLYPTLAQLADAGLVREGRSDGRVRVYALTPKGSRAVVAIVAQLRAMAAVAPSPAVEAAPAPKRARKALPRAPGPGVAGPRPRDRAPRPSPPLPPPARAAAPRPSPSVGAPPPPVEVPGPDPAELVYEPDPGAPPPGQVDGFDQRRRR